MKKNLIVSIFLFILMACSTTQSGSFVDENILLKAPIPGSGWKTRASENGHDTLQWWVKKGESFKLTIMRDRFRPEPEEYRAGLDDAAKQDFVSDLRSEVLKRGTVNNYPMILWRTIAAFKDGSKTFNLLLYIKGNDATYLVQRRWDSPQVTDDEKKLWIDYMLTISVIDNRYPDHAKGGVSDPLAR